MLDNSRKYKYSLGHSQKEGDDVQTQYKNYQHKVKADMEQI